jgi:hypothetical protein
MIVKQYTTQAGFHAKCVKAKGTGRLIRGWWMGDSTVEGVYTRDELGDVIASVIGKVNSRRGAQLLANPYVLTTLDEQPVGRRTNWHTRKPDPADVGDNPLAPRSPESAVALLQNAMTSVYGDHIRVYNCGYTGRTASFLEYCFDDLLNIYAPTSGTDPALDFAVIQVGLNEMAETDDISEEYRQYLESLISKLQNINPDIYIVLATPDHLWVYTGQDEGGVGTGYDPRYAFTEVIPVLEKLSVQYDIPLIKAHEHQIKLMQNTRANLPMIVLSHQGLHYRGIGHQFKVVPFAQHFVLRSWNFDGGVEALYHHDSRLNYVHPTFGPPYGTNQLPPTTGYDADNINTLPRYFSRSGPAPFLQTVADSISSEETLAETYFAMNTPGSVICLSQGNGQDLDYNYTPGEQIQLKLYKITNMNTPAEQVPMQGGQALMPEYRGASDIPCMIFDHLDVGFYRLEIAAPTTIKTTGSSGIWMPWLEFTDIAPNARNVQSWGFLNNEARSPVGYNPFQGMMNVPVDIVSAAAGIGGRFVEAPDRTTMFGAARADDGPEVFRYKGVVPLGGFIHLTATRGFSQTGNNLNNYNGMGVAIQRRADGKLALVEVDTINGTVEVAKQTNSDLAEATNPVDGDGKLDITVVADRTTSSSISQSSFKVYAGRGTSTLLFDATQTAAGTNASFAFLSAGHIGYGVEATGAATHTFVHEECSIVTPMKKLLTSNL